MRTFRLVLGAALALAVASPAFAGDIVFGKGNKKWGNPRANQPPAADDYDGSEFEIVEELLDKITYRIAGVATLQELPSADVVAIFHDPSTIPGGLDRGRRLVENGQADEAVEALAQVAGDARAPKWAQVEAAYRHGDALWAAGQNAKAAEALKAFLAKHANSRYVPDATRALAAVQLETGDVAAARETLNALKSMRGISESEKADVEYRLVVIDEQLARKSGDKAALEKVLKGYDTVLGLVRGKKEMATVEGLCTVGRASCLVGLARHAEAQPILEKIVAEAQDNAVRAAAHTLLGRSLVEQSAAEQNTTRYPEALLHFLRVVTLYSDASGVDDYVAESLFRAGQMFSELAPQNPKTEEEKAARSQGRSRAKREWADCDRRFPRSEWAKRARTALAGG